MRKLEVHNIMLDEPTVYVDWAITEDGENIGNKLSGRATLWCHATCGLLDAVERLQTVCRDAVSELLTDRAYGLTEEPSAPTAAPPPPQ